MSKTYEQVIFRLIVTPCCGHALCWVNPRLPTYCPECGKPLLTELRGDPSHIRVTDSEAVLEVEDGR